MSTAADLTAIAQALTDQNAALVAAGTGIIAALQAAQASAGPVTQAQLDAAVTQLQSALAGEQTETAALAAAVAPPAPPAAPAA